MKHIQTFESFINEAAKTSVAFVTDQEKIDYYLDAYEVYDFKKFKKSAGPLKAFLFDSDDEKYHFFMVIDKNGNGFLEAEAADGRDRPQDISQEFEFSGGEAEARKLIDKYRKHKYE